jgi:histidine decarboxylase
MYDQWKWQSIGLKRGVFSLQAMLEEAGVPVMMNRISTTVFFERPGDADLCHKWQLACQGDIAHVVVMPHITEQQLTAFVAELVESRCSSRPQESPPG